jgi:hypothetical protein
MGPDELGQGKFPGGLVGDGRDGAAEVDLLGAHSTSPAKITAVTRVEKSPQACAFYL